MFVCVCVLGSGMGRGCLDGDRVDVKVVPVVWGVSSVTVRGEARA